jgi:hypothetical protein
MRPFRVFGYACALVVFAASAIPANAGWHNVFQVCCNSCGSRPAVSFFAGPPDPCCNPCPQVCTTRYVQRCFYQPVTTYVTRSFYEAVTSYRTSFYWEPVTTVRYTSFFDACSCSWQQQACTSTSYQLRSQCCPVQSWVQRCVQQPVTSYRQCSYWEPVTTCSDPCAAPAVAVPAVPAPVTGEPPPAAQPGVGEGRVQPQTPQPAIRENRGTNGSGSPLYDQNFPRGTSHPMPNATGSSMSPRPQPLPVRPPTPLPVQKPATVRLEQIVSIPGNSADVKLASAVDTPKWTPKR